MERSPGLLGRYLGGSLSPQGPGSAREWSAQLEDAEAKIAGAHRLWQREFAAITVRGILKTLDIAEPGAVELRDRCLRLADRMRALDEEDFAPLRARVASKKYGPAEFLRELEQRMIADWDPFAERLLGIQDVPGAEKDLGVDMVHYLPSKMEVIRDVLTALRAIEDPVFYDLGSGLGKVTMLVGWLLGVRSIGVEFDPAYARAAERRARELGFETVEMICADAREVDYSAGNVFFLYDPFRGDVLTAVLERLRAVSEAHPITILSRGNTNEALANVSWLTRGDVFPSNVIRWSSM